MAALKPTSKDVSSPRPALDCSEKAKDQRSEEIDDKGKLAASQRMLQADLTQTYNALIEGSANLKGQVPVYPAIPDSAKEEDLLSDIRAATCEFKASEWKRTCEAKKGKLESYIKRIKDAQAKAVSFEKEVKRLSSERRGCEQLEEARKKQGAKQKGTIEKSEPYYPYTPEPTD